MFIYPQHVIFTVMHLLHRCMLYELKEKEQRQVIPRSSLALIATGMYSFGEPMLLVAFESCRGAMF